METATYMTTKPVAVVEGNHESCGFCLQNVPEIPYSAGNFTHYKARFHSVSMNSNSGNNRYYSFERGLTHFLVFTAESYVYAVSAEFNANQKAFMQADLKAVDRKRTPWVVALVHKDWTMRQFPLPPSGTAAATDASVLSLLPKLRSQTQPLPQRRTRLRTSTRCWRTAASTCSSAATCTTTTASESSSYLRIETTRNLAD